MPTKAYHKLVRDRIPEIIEAGGKICVCETLTDEDYIGSPGSKAERRAGRVPGEQIPRRIGRPSGSHADCRESPWLDIGRSGTNTDRQSGQAGWI